MSWDRHSSLWQARFRQSDGTSLFIGQFQEAEAAGRAYDEYALQQGGPAAVRNAMPSTLTGILLQHTCVCYLHCMGRTVTDILL